MTPKRNPAIAAALADFGPRHAARIRARETRQALYSASELPAAMIERLRNAAERVRADMREEGESRG